MPTQLPFASAPTNDRGGITICESCTAIGDEKAHQFTCLFTCQPRSVCCCAQVIYKGKTSESMPIVSHPVRIWSSHLAKTTWITCPPRDLWLLTVLPLLWPDSSLVGLARLCTLAWNSAQQRRMSAPISVWSRGYPPAPRTSPKTGRSIYVSAHACTKFFAKPLLEGIHARTVVNISFKATSCTFIHEAITSVPSAAFAFAWRHFLAPPEAGYAAFGFPRRETPSRFRIVGLL